MSNSQHKLSLRIYYEDTDAGRVVYHANYLKFLERARTEWLRSLGFEQSALMESDNLLFVVVSLNLQFKKPTYFDEEIVVETELTKLKGFSLILRQEIENESGEIVCEGTAVIACVNRNNHRPMRIPPEIKKRVSNVY